MSRSLRRTAGVAAVALATALPLTFAATANAAPSQSTPSRPHVLLPAGETRWTSSLWRCHLAPHGAAEGTPTQCRRFLGISCLRMRPPPTARARDVPPGDGQPVRTARRGGLRGARRGPW